MRERSSLISLPDPVGGGLAAAPSEGVSTPCDITAVLSTRTRPVLREKSNACSSSGKRGKWGQTAYSRAITYGCQVGCGPGDESGELLVYGWKARRFVI